MVAAALLASTIVPAWADDYSDVDYATHDLDNIARSVGPGSRQLSLLTDVEQASTLAIAGVSEWLSNVATQVGDLPSGRLYVSLGQLLPGAGVGDPRSYGDIEPIEVDFASRTGALLHGRLWWDGQPGPHPGVVITSGSIQSPAVGYHWAAQSLAANGYLVLTWDPQGQGESEMFGHEPGSTAPTGDGVPFQQAPNFVDGTVDALRFLLSDAAGPYVPGSWTDDDAAAHRSGVAGTGLSWANPLTHVLDSDNVGIVGHSLGAGAVSIVQQCSDASDRWADVPTCGGRSFPIRAVVGWDRLSGGEDIVPVVPGMDQEADGYFINPQPTLEAPDPNATLAAFDAWQSAGVDSYAITFRGGTHCEWSWIPLICVATGYGLRTADFYTTAWLDRYVHPDRGRRAAAGRALIEGPVPDGTTGGADEFAYRANFFSARYLSAYDCRCSLTGPRTSVVDVRAASGLSPVGDWAGANADSPAVRPG